MTLRNLPVAHPLLTRQEGGGGGGGDKLFLLFYLQNFELVENYIQLTSKLLPTKKDRL